MATDRPPTSPGALFALPRNGETTGVRRMTAAVEAHGAPPDLGAAIHAAIEAGIAKSSGGPGGGHGGGSPIDLSRLSKKNWLANFLIAIVVGGSGIFGAYKATESRSKHNEEEVLKNKAEIRMVKDDVADIKISVDDVGDKVDRGLAVQARLATSLDSLTEEQKSAKEKRLKEENERLRELLRGRGR